jgi:hypothetical protein
MRFQRFRSAAQLWLSVLLTYPTIALPNLQFDEVGERIGIAYSGLTAGLTWADINSDGYPDLLVSPHFGANLPSRGAIIAYVNADGERFIERGAQLFGRGVGDTHGISTADFDNDNRMDVFVSYGGGSGRWMSGRLTAALSNKMSNRLFEHAAPGIFTDVAGRSGLAFPRHRGRRATWFDLDGDGRLDIVLARGDATPQENVLLNRGNQFEPIRNALPSLPEDRDFRAAFIFPGFADDSLHLSYFGQESLLYRHLKRGSFEPRPPSNDQSGFLKRVRRKLARWSTSLGFPNPGPVQVSGQDAVMVDVDGDLALELISVQPCSEEEMIIQRKGAVFNFADRDQGIIMFRASTGRLVVRPGRGPYALNSRGTGPNYVYLGASGEHPNQNMILLDSSDPKFWGSLKRRQLERGLLVHYEPAKDLWTLEVRKGGSFYARVELTKMADFEVTKTPNLTRRNCSGYYPLHIATQGRYTWEKQNDYRAYPVLPSNCRSISSGDFDNDGRVDLALSCSQEGTVVPLLLMNRGDVFGVVKPWSRPFGPGRIDAISTADYDNDGRLDLALANGEGNLPSMSGRLLILQNRSNVGNWVKIRLRGTDSAVDAFGARVFVSANAKTQLRYANGGGRALAQDEQVLHFGIGEAETIESVLVEWPTGVLESFDVTDVNQAITLVEGGGHRITGARIVTARRSLCVGETVRLLLLDAHKQNASRVTWSHSGTNELKHGRSVAWRVHRRGELKLVAQWRTQDGGIAKDSIRLNVVDCDGVN